MDIDLFVLILVVVDDGLVLPKRSVQIRKLVSVLILVVVDDGLVHVQLDSNKRTIPVLILIVVDNGLVQNYERF